MTLPYDICRCDGVRDKSDELVTPCNTCRRVLHQLPQGLWTPKFINPPLKNGVCEYVVHIN